MTDMEKQEIERKRILDLRELQLRSAALSRDAGDMSADDLSEFACRYAAAVRDWMVVQHIRRINNAALAETVRGETCVQA